MARAAAQTAEDARELAIKRKGDAEIGQAQDRAAEEHKLRERAEAKALEAQAQADADRAALEGERARLAALITAPPPPPPPPIESPEPSTIVEPDLNQPDPNRADPNRAAPNQERSAARAALIGQLRASVNGDVEVIDAPRGVVVMVPDADFRGEVPNGALGPILARVAPSLTRRPGLAVEVDGYTDLPGKDHESIAVQRAEEVRAELVRAGLDRALVTVRGMGASHPLGSNSSAAGREQNRRIEIVISGSAIGNLPLWDKTYTLSLER